MDEEEPATPEETEALRQYLCESSSTDDAAKAIMNMSEAKIPLDDKVFRVATLLLDAATNFPERQTRILDLVDAIRALSDDDLYFTEEQQARYPDWQTWKEFEKFDFIFDDAYRSARAWRFTLDTNDDDPQVNSRRWTSLTALMAHMCMRHHDLSNPYLYGLDNIRSALEQESWSSSSGIPISPLLALDVEVPAAAQWILIAGDKIFECIDNEQFTTRLENSDLWQREISLSSKERWNLWRRRLHSISEMKDLRNETRAVAKKARVHMDDVENASSGTASEMKAAA